MAAVLTNVARTFSRSNAERLINFKTSAVAACCRRASVNWRFRAAVSVLAFVLASARLRFTGALPPAGELRAAFVCLAILARPKPVTAEITRKNALEATQSAGGRIGDRGRKTFGVSAVGTFRTCRDVRAESAFGGKSDLTIATADFR